MFKLRSATLLLPLFAATLAGAGALVPTQADAAGGSFYRAELASPAPTGKFVAKGIVWSCEGTNCGAGRGTSRPLIICAGLAKQAGEVKSFAADGKAFEAEDLARCNGGK